KGDVSKAHILNSGDIGLLSLDNKENRDIQTDVQSVLLGLATGSTFGRAYSDGSIRGGMYSRPVVVISCIEGTGYKEELSRRTTEVQFAKPEADGTYKVEDTKKRIFDNRSLILSSLASVLQRFLQLVRDGVPSVADMPPSMAANHPRNYEIDCALLRAF